MSAPDIGLARAANVLRLDAPNGACQAWVDSRDARCGRPTDGVLCARHAAVANRRLEASRRRNAARSEASAAVREQPRVTREARLRLVEAEMARLDPPPPTTDVAAFCGVGSTTARRYQDKFTPARIHRLAELTTERARLQALL